MALGPCDLHIHTTHSDGYVNPAMVVQRAILHGLRAFSVADHDTTKAIMDVHHVLHKLDLLAFRRPIFVPAVEVSAEYLGQEIHLLAYFPFGGEYRLESFLVNQQERREARNRAMCEKLIQLGYPITYKMLTASTGNLVGREHMALVLVQEGYYSNPQICYAELLDYGKPAFVPRELDQAENVLLVLRRAGAVPVLAHPFKYFWFQDEAKDPLYCLEELRGMGLEGVETVHGQATDEQMEQIATMAKELGLLRTSGSDVHLTYAAAINKIAQEKYKHFLN